jgi:hypothetical protein
MYVYVASSWRNEEQPVFCDMLSKMAIAHYDFRNPPERTGFGWQDVMIDWDINDPLLKLASRRTCKRSRMRRTSCSSCLATALLISNWDGRLVRESARHSLSRTRVSPS